MLNVNLPETGGYALTRATAHATTATLVFIHTLAQKLVGVRVHKLGITPIACSVYVPKEATMAHYVLL